MMKKFFAMTLTLVLTMSLFAGCGKAQSETTAPAETTPPVQTETTAPAVTGPASALEILENVWAAYEEGERFAIMGGNMESGIMDAPGAYDLTYAENMTYNLLIPAQEIANVDEVASMIHAMNANTFTCGAFHMAPGVAAAAFADAMQAAVQGNMWMCGFPERLVIASVADEFVVVAFGVGDAMTPFHTHLMETYPEARILFDEPIA